MKSTIIRAGSAIAALTILAGGLLSGCSKMSESILDDTAGMNGGFEVVESGLPVNWLVYTPETIPTGDYDLVIDRVEYHAGRQSLKFVVRACSSDGGWLSPGLSREFEVTPGQTYTVGFWVRNEGAEFLVTIGGVTALEGESETVVRSSETIATWKHYEHVYAMPAESDRLRFELSIVQPGTFWIDEISISGISEH